MSLISPSDAQRAYDPLLHSALDSVATPRQRASSSLVAPAADPMTYVASGWTESARGSVQMRTVLPAIRFGGSELQLRAKPGSDLAQLLGTAEPSFDRFDSVNTFESAAMSVTRSE